MRLRRWAATLVTPAAVLAPAGCSLPGTHEEPTSPPRPSVDADRDGAIDPGIYADRDPNGRATEREHGADAEWAEVHAFTTQSATLPFDLSQPAHRVQFRLRGDTAYYAQTFGLEVRTATGESMFVGIGVDTVTAGPRVGTFVSVPHVTWTESNPPSHDPHWNDLRGSGGACAYDMLGCEFDLVDRQLELRVEGSDLVLRVLDDPRIPDGEVLRWRASGPIRRLAARLLVPEQTDGCMALTSSMRIEDFAVFGADDQRIRAQPVGTLLEYPPGVTVSPESVTWETDDQPLSVHWFDDGKWVVRCAGMSLQHITEEGTEFPRISLKSSGYDDSAMELRRFAVSNDGARVVPEFRNTFDEAAARPSSTMLASVLRDAAEGDADALDTVDHRVRFAGALAFRPDGQATSLPAARAEIDARFFPAPGAVPDQLCHFVRAYRETHVACVQPNDAGGRGFG